MIKFEFNIMPSLQRHFRRLFFLALLCVLMAFTCVLYIHSKHSKPKHLGSTLFKSERVFHGVDHKHNAHPAPSINHSRALEGHNVYMKHAPAESLTPADGDKVVGSYRVRKPRKYGKFGGDWVKSDDGQSKKATGWADAFKKNTTDLGAPSRILGSSVEKLLTVENETRGSERSTDSKTPTRVIKDAPTPLDANGTVYGRTFSLFMPEFPDRRFTFKDDDTVYFKRFQDSFRCFIEGTVTMWMSNDPIECKCRSGWHGHGCSVPELVFKSDYPHEHALIMRKGSPRRIVYGMPFLNEFDLLEAKIHMLYDVIDVFIILESNFTAAGKPNDRRLLKRLKNGFLWEFQDKILYLRMQEFPASAYTDGWIIDRLLRTRIGQAALTNLDLNDDDVIVVTDVDEMPLRETLLFIKLHDGFTEPFGFVLRHNVFGFFWRGLESDVTSNIFGGATVGYVKHVAEGDLSDLRGSSLSPKDRRLAQDFEKCCRGVIRPWLFGTWELPAGWHCSWCLRPEDIVLKLQAAHVSDQPRWGSHPRKTKLDYIKHLIHTGTWFDDKKRFFSCTLYEDIFAPKYVRQNPEQFEYLMTVP